MISNRNAGAIPLLLVCLILISTFARAQPVSKTDADVTGPPATVLSTLETKKEGDILIVGGTTAGPNDNPFQVGLLVKAVGDNFKAQFCGGSLIAPDVIVTAAHCNYYQQTKNGPKLLWKPSEVQVLTGTRNLNQGGVRRDVTAIWQHPSYMANGKNYDVAVWKLSTQVQGIPFAQLATSDGTVGSELLVTGWGATGEGKGSSPVLLKVSVPVVSHETCEAAYAPSSITPQMLCAGFGPGGKDSCQGDSGGPATRSRDNMTLTGIVSFGRGCARPDIYGVYTRVSDPEIRDFIRQYLN
ncbi:serine protease [Pseudomonas chlororaphis]|uniref:serine protease n=1 Tax=Pseudomonas chlororaphis TaxID=587753 RepID=UPI00138A62B8|nr:serine protease [Pseudomonas chlororaphis]